MKRAKYLNLGNICIILLQLHCDIVSAEDLCSPFLFDDDSVEFPACISSMKPLSRPEVGGAVVQIGNGGPLECPLRYDVEIFCRFRSDSFSQVFPGLLLRRADVIECISPFSGQPIDVEVSYAAIPRNCSVETANWITVGEKFQYFDDRVDVIVSNFEDDHYQFYSPAPEDSKRSSRLFFTDNPIKIEWNADALELSTFRDFIPGRLSEFYNTSISMEILAYDRTMDLEESPFQIVKPIEIPPSYNSTTLMVDKEITSAFMVTNWGSNETRATVIQFRVVAHTQQYTNDDEILERWILSARSSKMIGILPKTAKDYHGESPLDFKQDCKFADECDLHPCPPSSDGQNQCCYAKSGGLITQNDDESSRPKCYPSDSTRLETINNFLFDDLTFLHCCHLNDASESNRNGLPATLTDNVYNSTIASHSIGDPHLTTFDNVEYDFDGYGEYVALCGNDEMLTLEELLAYCNPSRERLVPGRKMLSINYRFAALTEGQNGTVTVGIAIEDPGFNSGARSLVVVPHPIRRLDVYDGANLVQFSKQGRKMRQQLSGTIITKPVKTARSNLTHFIMDISLPSGLNITITETGGEMFPAITRPPNLTNIVGLLGRPDGNRRNDFTDASGNILDIPIDQGIYTFEQTQAIFYNFGQTWMARPEASLFRHLDDFDDYYRPDFKPWFEVPPVIAESNGSPSTQPTKSTSEALIVLSSSVPSISPSASPIKIPSMPSATPTNPSSIKPTNSSSVTPTGSPLSVPSMFPSAIQTNPPSIQPTKLPSVTILPSFVAFIPSSKTATNLVPLLLAANHISQVLH